MKNIFTLILMICSLCPQTTEAAGGSRVGGGSKIFSLDGDYSFEVPQLFMKSSPLENGTRLKGPAITVMKQNGFIMIPQTREQAIEVLNLSAEIPEFKKFSQEQVDQWMRKNNYKARSLETRCLLVRSISKNDLITAIVAWGKGQGVTISADKSEVADQAVDEIVKSLRIEKGECQWN